MSNYVRHNMSYESIYCKYFQHSNVAVRALIAGGHCCRLLRYKVFETRWAMIPTLLGTPHIDTKTANLFC